MIDATSGGYVSALRLKFGPQTCAILEFAPPFSANDRLNSTARLLLYQFALRVRLERIWHSVAGFGRVIKRMGS